MNKPYFILSMEDRDLLKQMSASGQSTIGKAFIALAGDPLTHNTYRGNRPEAIRELQDRILGELKAFAKDHPAFNATRDRILGSVDGLLKSWAAQTNHFSSEEGPLEHEHVIKVEEHATAVILRKQLEGTGFKVVVVGSSEIITKEELENEEFKRELREAMELDNQFVGKEFPYQRELLTAEVKTLFDQFCVATNDYKWLRDKIIGTMNAEFTATVMDSEGTVISFPVSDPAANLQTLEDLRGAVLRGDKKIVINDIENLSEIGRQRLISSIGPVQHFPHIVPAASGDLNDPIRQLAAAVSDKETVAVYWSHGSLTDADREKLAKLFGRMIKQNDLFMGNSLETQKSLLMQNIKALFVDFSKATGNYKNWLNLQERFLKVLAYDLTWSLGPVDQDGEAFYQGNSHCLVAGMPKLGYDVVTRSLIDALGDRRAESFTWAGLTDLTDAERATFAERFKRAFGVGEEATLVNFQAEVNPNSIVEGIIQALQDKINTFTWKGMNLLGDKQREYLIEQFQHALYINKEENVSIAGGSAEHLAIGLRNVLLLNGVKTGIIIGMEHMSPTDHDLVRNALSILTPGDHDGDQRQETLEKSALVELHPMQSITLGGAPSNIEPLLEAILEELKKDRPVEWGAIPDVPKGFPRQSTLPGGDMQFSYKGNTVTFGVNGDLTINASGSIKNNEYLG